MSVYQKIQNCIASIKASNLEKQGYNTFSKYAYYTPEQVDKLVYDACLTEKLFNKFDLVRNELGIFGQLTITDLENDKDSEVFLMASDIPSIKATNISQQLGGAMTFTKRYMLQNTYDIVDNNLDFDTDKKPSGQGDKKEDIEWLDKKIFEVIMKRTDPAKVKNAIVHWSKDGRKMSNDYKSKLNNRIDELNKGA